MNRSNQEEILRVAANDQDVSDEQSDGRPTRLHREEFQSLPQARPAHLNSRSSLLQTITRPLLQSPHRHYLYAAALIALIIFGWALYPRRPPPPPIFRPDPPVSNNLTFPELSIHKPQGIKVIGLVFYGRRSRASILDCYLRRNLASSGGWLDEVIWGVNTDNAEDLAYLEQVLVATAGYRKVELKHRSYYDLWETSLQRGNIYVKIDDDVVYMEDDAIPLIVDALVTNPEAMMISSNIINSPKLSWLQYRTGAILPYLPEIEKRPNKLSTVSNPIWRPSELPNWIEPRGFHIPEAIEDFYTYFRGLMYRADVEEGTDHLPPHRWLPVTGPGAISKTPIIHTEFRNGGKGLFNWAIAAQEHYSFFEHLEHDRKYMYFLLHGSGLPTDGLWDQTGERISINLIALRGELVLDNLEKMAAHGDDEGYLTEVLPAQVNKSTFFSVH
jgi:hypothetical protein